MSSNSNDPNSSLDQLRQFVKSFGTKLMSDPEFAADAVEDMCLNAAGELMTAIELLRATVQAFPHMPVEIEKRIRTDNAFRAMLLAMTAAEALISISRKEDEDEIAIRGTIKKMRAATLEMKDENFSRITGLASKEVME